MDTPYIQPKIEDENASTQTRVWTKTLDKLRTIARMTGRSQVEVIDLLATEELARQQAQQKGDKES